MDPMKLNALTRPVVTGTPAAAPQGESVQTGTAGENGPSFLSVLQQQLETGSNTAFSKHAVSRVAQRQIDVSSQKLQRLSQGMELARQKGLKDALILIDNSAYIVNAAAGKVVTVNGEAGSGSVFTNIDGTVVI